jgi:hypothetical protein
MSSLSNSEFSIDISGNLGIDKEYNSLLVPFWAEDPNVILNTKYITEFFPVEKMTYNQQLNAISRTILLLTLITFALTFKTRILIIGAITIGAIYMLFHYHKKEAKKNEGFENPALAVLEAYPTDPIETFDAPTDTNPFSNVLLPDYDYNVQKKPAPPSFNVNVQNTILAQAKQLVIDQNPGQPDIAKKLFTDLGEQFEFEQSLQPFYSNASTTIPNDQAGFADFCYGSMVSCKEGNLFSCARNLDRHTN